jgi:hypothetical protein
MFKSSVSGYDKEQVDNNIKELLKTLEKSDQDEQNKLDLVKQQNEYLTSFAEFLKEQLQMAKLREEVNSKAGDNLPRILKGLNEESDGRMDKIRLEVDKCAQDAQEKIQQIEEEKKQIMQILQVSIQEVGEAYNLVAVAKKSMEVR